MAIPHLLPCCGYLPWRSRGLNTDSWRPPWGQSSRSLGEFEGPLSAKSIYSMTSKWSSSNSKQVAVFPSRRIQINLLDEQVAELAVPEGSKIFSTRLLCASRRSNFFGFDSYAKRIRCLGLHQFGAESVMLYVPDSKSKSKTRVTVPTSSPKRSLSTIASNFSGQASPAQVHKKKSIGLL
jgi:hypothetical protein